MLNKDAVHAIIFQALANVNDEEVSPFSDVGSLTSYILLLLSEPV